MLLSAGRFPSVSEFPAFGIAGGRAHLEPVVAVGVLSCLGRGVDAEPVWLQSGGPGRVTSQHTRAFTNQDALLSLGVQGL